MAESKRLSFSIITPTLNGMTYLPRCVASVADQYDVTVEHIVVDGESADGTVEWLKAQKNVRWISEPDRSVYEAMNKGINMAKGDVILLLNCDEQLLPGSLKLAEEEFAKHPGADVIFGDLLFIHPDGNLVGIWKAYPLRWWYVLTSHLYALTCAMFFRRRVLDEGWRFSEAWQDVGDADLVVQLLKKGCSFHHLRRLTTAFTLTGKNRSAQPCAEAEKKQLLAAAPAWMRYSCGLLNKLRLLEKKLYGAEKHAGGLTYEVYGPAVEAGRQTFSVQKPIVNRL
jgi:glycosyltransferase involved in cell wall biosynthesis